MVWQGIFPVMKTLHVASQLVLSERHGDGLFCVGISSWFALGVFVSVIQVKPLVFVSNHLFDTLLQLVDAVK